MAGFQVRWGVLVSAFAFGMFMVYVLEPPYELIHKFPTPYDADTLVYHDMAGGCYMFKAREVPCTKDAVAQPVGA